MDAVIIHISVDQKRRLLDSVPEDAVLFDLATGSFQIDPWPQIVFHPLVTPDTITPTPIRARSGIGDHMEPETTRR